MVRSTEFLTTPRKLLNLNARTAVRRYSLAFILKASLKKYFAYTRVSTARQGEQGVSLQQQHDAIERFATRSGLEIYEWLEEQETAAKIGRPVFSRMLRRLRMAEVDGVIIHKIDRSARNLKDWAELGQLIDQGIEVHFANEALDLNSRGGRLSADIQAVVAADYIRNLREEAKKGFYGRLKQGILPLPAPIGYLDCGPGKAKVIDPIRGPVVQQIFDLYATGRYSLIALTAEAYRLGLRSKKGRRFTRNGIHRMLRNKFYIGLIHVHVANETFIGSHESLISKSVFDRVDAILTGKKVRGPSRHGFLFSRMIQCKTCKRSLVAEHQKENIYYRCHSRNCPSTSLREEAISGAISKKIRDLKIWPEELEILDQIVEEKKEDHQTIVQAEIEGYRFRAAALAERHNRLTDAYLDGTLARVDYEQRKTALLSERRELEDKLRAAERGESGSLHRINEYVELVKNAYLLDKHGFSIERRDVVEDVVSNRTATGKTIEIALKTALSDVIARPGGPNGGLRKDKARKFWRQWLDKHSSTNDVTDQPTYR